MTLQSQVKIYPFVFCASDEADSHFSGNCRLFAVQVHVEPEEGWFQCRTKFLFTPAATLHNLHSPAEMEKVFHHFSPRQRADPSFQMFGFISYFFNNKTSFPKRDFRMFLDDSHFRENLPVFTILGAIRLWEQSSHLPAEGS